MIREYAKRSKPMTSSAFAFIGDNDYLLPLDDTEPVAAAAQGSKGSTNQAEVHISLKEYEELKKNSTTASTNSFKKGDSKLRIAKGYCILCGHGAHDANIGKLCFKMSTNGIPSSGYTISQLMCTSETGGPVDNMPRSKVVMKGFEKE